MKDKTWMQQIDKALNLGREIEAIDYQMDRAPIHIRKMWLKARKEIVARFKHFWPGDLARDVSSGVDAFVRKIRGRF